MPSDHGSKANRQAVLRQLGSEYVVLDGDVPQVGPTQALVRLTHSGCCYTYVLRVAWDDIADEQRHPIPVRGAH
jgi:hypothetical protein